MQQDQNLEECSQGEADLPDEVFVRIRPNGLDAFYGRVVKERDHVEA